MSQIKIVQEGVDIFDLGLDPDEGDRLALDETFETAILISILTDRRCEPSEAPDPADLGGYWGDTYPDAPGDSMGSRLWTLVGREWTAESQTLADAYVRECLTWMVEDGIISDTQESLQVDLRFERGVLYGRVVISRPGAVVPRWDVAWTRTMS